MPKENVADILACLHQEIRAFLGIRRRTTEVIVGPVSLFVRKAVRAYLLSEHDKPVLLHSLDIASIQILEEMQSQGIGSAVIREIHALNPFEATYIESVNEHRLTDHLERNGWSIVSGDRRSPCFIKVTGRSGKIPRPLSPTHA